MLAIVEREIGLISMATVSASTLDACLLQMKQILLSSTGQKWLEGNSDKSLHSNLTMLPLVPAKYKIQCLFRFTIR
jgi:hypothetical protein